MVHPVGIFNVVPSLPPAIEHLRELAYDTNFSWHHDAVDLFRRLGPERWEECGHNPVLLLGTVPQEQLTTAASDPGFLAHLNRVWRRHRRYLDPSTTWFNRQGVDLAANRIAYFSAEYGLTECLPIYSGGLGILSGDHLKSASDLGLPLVGVGLLYQQGYFRQYLNEDGWQGETFAENDFANQPLTLERTPNGSPVVVTLDFPGRRVSAQLWRVQVGRVSLFLLDTNIPTNSRGDQDITDRLYSGDRDMRIRQELILGIAGVRALGAIGYKPTVIHLNEGHCAFAALERIRHLMLENGLSFAEAREAASAGLVFTTHTPVPAGNDYFPSDMVDRYFADYYRSLGLSRREFMALGRQNPDDDGEQFCMTVLALRLANYSNAVSRLHGHVSRRMWQQVWPRVPVEELPIGHITNGVHFPSWISQDIADLYDRYLGHRWMEDPADQSVWGAVTQIPPEELWRTHERRRERLVTFARGRLRFQMQRRGASPAALAQAEEVLDAEALTIGFARRFATYKRGTLLFHDPDRLARILGNYERPVQIIIAGKAHPEDSPAKELIRQIIHRAREDRFRTRLVFIEDYDMNVARYLVQGVDVWLNTPRRPLEASGTSGMKVAANGGLNISILDGWWDEAYQPGLGWAVGRGEEYDDLSYQDGVESSALYNVLEQEVVPTFYDRGRDGLPRRWITLMKQAMAALCPVFNTNRMVHHYARGCYLPAADRYARLAEGGFQRARALASWKGRVTREWSNVMVREAKAELPAELRVGDHLSVAAVVDLGALAPSDVTVELYLGRVDARGMIIEGKPIPMLAGDNTADGQYEFAAASIPCTSSGQLGYTVRVLPAHEDMVMSTQSGLIAWASPNGRDAS